MKQFTPYFMSEFHDKLLKPNGNNPIRDRASGFKKIFEILDAKQEWMVDYHYKIAESGCMRPDHGELCYGDDGCSTVIFDSFVSQMGGEVLSVDINPINVEYSRKHVSENTHVYCEDSVLKFYGIHNRIKYDLIYLDSFDLDQKNPHLSMLHHMKEIAAIMKNTNQGTIIAIDDHISDEVGKGNYVKSFMESINAKLIHNGYQIIWQL